MQAEGRELTCIPLQAQAAAGRYVAGEPVLPKWPANLRREWMAGLRCKNAADLSCERVARLMQILKYSVYERAAIDTL